MLLLAMVYQVCVSNMINLPHVVVDWKKVCFNWWRWNTTDFSGQKKRSAVVVRRIMKIYGNDAPKLLGIPSKDHSQPYTYIDIPQFLLGIHERLFDDELKAVCDFITKKSHYLSRTRKVFEECFVPSKEILQFLKVFRELQREDFDTGCLPPPCLKSKSFIDFYKSKAVRKIMASATYQPIFMRWLAKVEGYRSGWWMHGAGPKCGFDGKEIKFSRRIKNIDHIAREFLRKTPRQFFEKYYELLLDEYDAMSPKAQWQLAYDGARCPEDMVQLPYLYMVSIKPVIRYFMRNLKTRTTANFHHRLAVANLSILLGEKANQYVQDRTEAILGPDPLRNKPGCYAENADFWHDRGVNIDPFMADSEVLWKFRKAPETEGVDFLPQIANKWQSLKTNDIKTYRDAKKALMATLYGNVKIPELVAEAAKAGLKQQLFETVQERVLLRKTDTYETIPSIVAEEGDYRMFRLEKDDYRGLFLGVYTNCCQHVGGVGHTCAWHGFENPDGGFYVVTKNDKIIAQSWVWRNDTDFCFDNIEALSTGYMPLIANLYQQVGNALLGKLGITRVLVGAAFDKLGVEKYWKKTSTPARSPEGCYTDAIVQFIIAEN